MISEGEKKASSIEFAALENLQKLGYTEYESRVFLTLYKGFCMPAPQIAKTADIPRTAIYPILKKFVKLGICTEIEHGRKFEYELTEKHILKDKLQIEIDTVYKTKISGIKSLFSLIEPLYKTIPVETDIPKIDVVRGYNMHREIKYNRLLKNCKKSSLLMNRFRGYVSDELEQTSKDAIKRGVELRSIYEFTDNFKIKINGKWERPDKKKILDLYKKYEAQGEKIRILDKVPQIMDIFDSETVFISFSGEKIPTREMTDIIVKSKDYAQLMKDMFEMYWKKGMTIKEFEKK